ncbi:MAG: anti-sigma factor, partial [Ilumatobacter sp.]
APERLAPDSATWAGPDRAPVDGSSASRTPGVRSGPDRRRRSSSVWILGAAAAVVLAVAGAVVVIGSRGPAAQDPITEAYVAALAAPGSVQAELVADGSPMRAVGVIDASGHGYVDAAALPRLSADQTYQLWGVFTASGDVVSLGILGGDPGMESFTVHTDLSALAITIEQSPGVITDGNADGAFVGAIT